jgi:hypothetical protein
MDILELCRARKRRFDVRYGSAADVPDNSAIGHEPTFASNIKGPNECSQDKV